MENQLPKKKEPQVISITKPYLKAIPLQNLTDLEDIKNELETGNILIIRINPLAEKSIDDVITVVNEISKFTSSIGGEIARLGNERIVVTPAWIKIWRGEKDTHEE